jgi:predicted ATP-dependent endonuclease of OLD family
MYLKSIYIRNFRGIPRAKVTLEETTILIGENDSGKSSIIDALSKTLILQSDGFWRLFLEPCV